jgi:ABC-2 type transport system permease protein
MDRIADWSKWKVVLLLGTHQMIAQLFPALFFVNVSSIPELVRTGKLDSLLVLPIDSQFAVSTKQFSLHSVLDAILGGVVVIVSLSNLPITPSAGIVLLYLCGGLLRRRGALFYHAQPRRRQLLDRSRSRTGLRLT